MTKQELLQKADSLPLSPGVYIMMDKTGLVIYVGKAKKLKNRVSQYFQSGSGHNEKTRMMVSQVDHFDTIMVRTEFEALILENSLIKRHQPRYNILLKDDKGYPFVRLNEKAPYPRFTLVNKPEEDGARYFGPFGGRHETRAALQAVCAALKLPTCNRQFPRDIGKERPCLNHHIGKCDGFCSPDGPGQGEYQARMAQAAELLGGKLRQVTAALRQEMEQAAENLEFEKAAALRDRMQALQVLGKQQQVIAGVCADTDVWGVYTGSVRCGAAVLHIENGDLLGRQIEIFPTAADQSEPEVLSAVLSQYYLDKAVLPREILLPCLFDDSDTFAALLTGRAGHKVTIKAPQRGERSQLVDMAAQNAREEAERITTESERAAKALTDLQTLAQLPAVPRRMESYDISNLGSDDMVASMVVFVDGKPLKRDYRKFAIKTLTGPDDYAAMQEVLERRFAHKDDEKFPPLPDLLLIDGGLGHVHAALAAERTAGGSIPLQAESACRVLERLGLTVPVLGMVKDDRHRTRALITVEGSELGIQQSLHIFTMIGRIQEEVHRFAITFQRQKHKKRTYRGKLDGIPGIGEARKQALLKRFGTVKAIEAASLDDLRKLLPAPAASAVYAHLHPQEPPKTQKD